MTVHTTNHHDTRVCPYFLPLELNNVHFNAVREKLEKWADDMHGDRVSSLTSCNQT